MKNRANAGFSLVELVIVIAIMAVLIGVLAPMFLRHVRNARMSTDIKNGQEIGTVMRTAITEGKLTGSAEKEELKSGTNIYKAVILDDGMMEMPQIRTSKTGVNKKWYISYNDESGDITVYCGGTNEKNIVYPEPTEDSYFSKQ